MDYEGLFMTLYTQKEERLCVTFYFADNEPLSCERRLLAGRNQCVKLTWKDFPVETSRETYWRYVTGVEIDTKAIIQKCQLRKRKYVYADFPVRGKSGNNGEEVIYKGTVYNCSDESVLVEAVQLYEGWESVNIGIKWVDLPDVREVYLNQGEGKELEISFLVHDDMVQGGHELSTVLLKAQGTGSGEERVSFYTMRSMPHPYIYHDRQGWKEVRNKIDSYEMYQPAWEEYQRLSEQALAPES